MTKIRPAVCLSVESAYHSSQANCKKLGVTVNKFRDFNWPLHSTSKIREAGWSRVSHWCWVKPRKSITDWRILDLANLLQTIWTWLEYLSLPQSINSTDILELQSFTRGSGLFYDEFHSHAQIECIKPAQSWTSPIILRTKKTQTM